jgi:hypothetical protein
MKMRKERPFVFCSLRNGEGGADVVQHIAEVGGLLTVVDE